MPAGGGSPRGLSTASGRNQGPPRARMQRATRKVEDRGQRTLEPLHCKSATSCSSWQERPKRRQENKAAKNERRRKKGSNLVRLSCLCLFSFAFFRFFRLSGVWLRPEAALGSWRLCARHNSLGFNDLRCRCSEICARRQDSDKWQCEHNLESRGRRTEGHRGRHPHRPAGLALRERMGACPRRLYTLIVNLRAGPAKRREIATARRVALRMLICPVDALSVPWYRSGRIQEEPDVESV
jgi:hypothetical protein